MPCVGPRLRSSASTSAQPVCAVPRLSSGNTTCTISRSDQLPIERVSDLRTSFDQIICTGVLHHLADPDAGLSALREVLKPDGAMHLMVYAPYGRAGIYMMQEFCRRIGLHANDKEIRDLIAALTAMPPGHPLENLLRESPDFGQEAALADALLNPQDRSYSVPQLFDFIGKAGLTFGRWIKQAPYTPHCGVLARIPQASRLKELSTVEQYAAVELFRGTMVRHSMVVYRNDSPELATSHFRRRRLAWLCAPSNARHRLCSRAAAPRGGGCADQPDTCLRGSDHANRFNREAVVRCH